MSSELMLEWMSETGTGDVRQLRERLVWLFRTEDVPATRTASGRWLRDLSTLGHAEIDWQNNRWSICPPVVTRLPAADGTAVLVGCRRQSLLDRLDDSPFLVTRVVKPPSGHDLQGPDSVFLQYDDVQSLAREAEGIGATYVGCTAERLGGRLNRIGPGLPTAPPAFGNQTLERLEDPTTASYVPANGSTAQKDGLYRVTLQGRLAHLYLLDGHWYRSELAEGLFLEFAARNMSVIRWRPDPGHGRSDIGTVFVDWGAPLPPLQSRALALCSGLPPRFSGTARTAIFVNVPLAVANAVASSLGQHLDRQS